MSAPISTPFWLCVIAPVAAPALARAQCLDPTGLRLAFSNSFALERHHLNFSTSRQWLWDELKLTLPPKGDPYQTVQQIHKIVERGTHADA